MKIRIKHLWKNFFSILLIAFHIHTGLCRPSVGKADDLEHELDALRKKGLHQSQVRAPPVYYDLRNVGPTELLHIMRRGNRKLLQTNDTLLLLYSSEKDSTIRFDASGGDVVDFIGDVSSSDDANNNPGDVIITSDKEGSVHQRHHQEVVPFTDRNLLVRKRRQPAPEQHRPHRRRRRKHHRLVLKAGRDRNHLSEDTGEEEEEDLKDHRRRNSNRFLIKSDSPGYVITSASEVKKDWCRTIPLRQKVSEPHCRSRVVQNNFCYGQCNSFFIPHTGRTDNKVAFQSCAFCKPFRQRWGNVTLNCPGRNPPKVEKTVLFVETCRCITEVLQ